MPRQMHSLEHLMSCAAIDRCIGYPTLSMLLRVILLWLSNPPRLRICHRYMPGHPIPLYVAEPALLTRIDPTVKKS
jgi:hypothetical protein